jgi:hypothetical protein
MPVTARNHLEGGGDDALAVTAGIGPPHRLKLCLRHVVVGQAETG